MGKLLPSFSGFSLHPLSPLFTVKAQFESPRSLKFITTFPPNRTPAGSFARDFTFGLELIEHDTDHIARHVRTHPLQVHHSEFIRQVPNRLKYHLGLGPARYSQQSHTLLEFTIGRD